MNNAIFSLREPKNEQMLNYLPGSIERQQLIAELERQTLTPIEIPLIIDGHEVRTSKVGQIVMPHDHQMVIAHYHQAGEPEVQAAIAAALKRKQQWMTLSWVERASVYLKIADLISHKYRHALTAATMLGQGKNVYQAEIDAIGESVDFLRYNAYYAAQIYNLQPKSNSDALNRLEYRPLEGFVFAISPFNFTAIGLNLCIAPAIMGNTIVWKPAATSLLSNYLLMKIYEEAGLPPGVINFIPGSGSFIGNIVLKHRALAGVHFTGGTATFQGIWRQVSANLDQYISFPKLVGETGGKGFVIAHASADPQEVATALVRGAFEYQGQKCSAASRAYLPQSLWPEIQRAMTGMLQNITPGDVKDFTRFMNAVIDQTAFDSIMSYIELARQDPRCNIIHGGKGDKSRGYYIEPTVIVTTDHQYRTMKEEIFGPVLTIYVYEDARFDEVLTLCDQTSPYALTGAIFARDRDVLITACRVLRYAAGNFYYNDKPTGAMVGLQPFGGARWSGTNDKAGGFMNLIRWTSPRTIKENFMPASDYRYPFMAE